MNGLWKALGRILAAILQGMRESRETQARAEVAKHVPKVPPRPKTWKELGLLLDYGEEDLDILTRTVFGEARGEPTLGQIAVAWVIVNRARNPRWWGRGIRGVCLQPWQFSSWNAGDPNRQLITALAKDDPRYLALRSLMVEVLAGWHPDPTRGADHYCTRAVAPKTKWARGKTPVAEIGNHLFYRLEL